MLCFYSKFFLQLPEMQFAGSSDFSKVSPDESLALWPCGQVILRLRKEGGIYCIKYINVYVHTQAPRSWHAYATARNHKRTERCMWRWIDLVCWNIGDTYYLFLFSEAIHLLTYSSVHAKCMWPISSCLPRFFLAGDVAVFYLSCIHATAALCSFFCFFSIYVYIY